MHDVFAFSCLDLRTLAYREVSPSVDNPSNERRMVFVYIVVSIGASKYYPRGESMFEIYRAIPYKQSKCLSEHSDTLLIFGQDNHTIHVEEPFPPFFEVWGIRNQLQITEMSFRCSAVLNWDRT